MKYGFALVFGLFASLLSVAAQTPAYDLIIRHGRIVGWFGHPAFLRMWP